MKYSYAKMNYLKMKWVMIWSFTVFKSFIYKLVQNMPIFKNCWWLQNCLLRFRDSCPQDTGIEDGKLPTYIEYQRGRDKIKASCFHSFVKLICPTSQG